MARAEINVTKPLINTLADLCKHLTKLGSIVLCMLSSHLKVGILGLDQFWIKVGLSLDWIGSILDLSWTMIGLDIQNQSNQPFFKSTAKSYPVGRRKDAYHPVLGKELGTMWQDGNMVEKNN